MCDYKKQKGFTFIELLLIVTIISLLASIVLVNFGTMKLSAQRSAVFTEARTLLGTVEECILSHWVLYCGGTENVIGSSANCGGGANAAPVHGTAICGHRNHSRYMDDKVWPDVAKKGYVYTGYTGSNSPQGLYAFTLQRDRNHDGVPDTDSTPICCMNTGCRELSSGVGAAQVCRASAGINHED